MRRLWLDEYVEEDAMRVIGSAYGLAVKTATSWSFRPCGANAVSPH
ncbi:MAG: hypothetical protein ABW000_14415 [Actinoplanes sp.]